MTHAEIARAAQCEQTIAFGKAEPRRDHGREATA